MQAINVFLLAILLISAPVAFATDKGAEVEVPVGTTAVPADAVVAVVTTEAAQVAEVVTEAAAAVTEAAAEVVTEAEAIVTTVAEAVVETTEVPVVETTEAPVPEPTQEIPAAPQGSDAPPMATEGAPVEEPHVESSGEGIAAAEQVQESTSRPMFSSTDEPIELSTSLEDLFNSTTNSTSASFRSAGSFFVAPIVLFALAQ